MHANQANGKQRLHPDPLHVVIFEAEDLPGQWVSHCLELDLVSQGNSKEQALEMIEDAIGIYAEEHAKHSRFYRDVATPAPKEAWDLFEKGTPLAESVLKRLEWQHVIARAA